MALTFHPEAGTILLCDFDTGFIAPEMVKNKRPVIVISPKAKRGGQLVTIVACSTRTPEPIESHHYKLPKTSLPKIGRYQNDDTWVKGDMIYTVGFHRLNLIQVGKEADGKRVYHKNRLGRDQMKDVYGCVLHALNLGHVIEHI